MARSSASRGSPLSRLARPTTTGWPIARPWPRCSSVARPCRSLRRSGTPEPDNLLQYDSSTTGNSRTQERPMTDKDNTLILETSKGKVVIEMRPDLAPGHVARIKELVRDGFYDGIVFHRVIDGFMAQTGCPHGTGTGGSGKKLKAEFNKEPHR